MTNETITLSKEAVYNIIEILDIFTSNYDTYEEPHMDGLEDEYIEKQTRMRENAGSSLALLNQKITSLDMIKTSEGIKMLETLQTLEVQKSCIDKIKALGQEGLFAPVIKSAADVDYLIIDLSLIRDISCDIGYTDLQDVLLVDTPLRACDLEELNYLFLTYEG